MEYVEIARAESDRGELVLRARREGPGPRVLELRANGVFVMDTQETTTERALANEALGLHDAPRSVLIGGLGLGFTLQEVLADPRVERVTVVEIEQALADWMRDGTIPHGPALLADERITVTVADIAVALTEATEPTYDLVLLDVDNGPGYLVHDANASLYHEPLLAAARGALRTGGVLVVWSADEAPTLEAAMRSVFGSADAAPYDVDLQGRSEHYWLYTAPR